MDDITALRKSIEELRADLAQDTAITTLRQSIEDLRADLTQEIAKNAALATDLATANTRANDLQTQINDLKAGNLNNLTVADTTSQASIGSDVLALGHSSNRASPGEALVANKDSLVINNSEESKAWPEVVLGGGSTIVQGTLTAKGDMTIDKSATVKGDMSVKKSITIEGDLIVNGNLIARKGIGDLVKDVAAGNYGWRLVEVNKANRDEFPGGPMYGVAIVKGLDSNQPQGVDNLTASVLMATKLRLIQKIEWRDEDVELGLVTENNRVQLVFRDGVGNSVVLATIKKV
jgi:hypothetical protein